MRKHLNDNEKIEFKYLLELVSSSVNGTAPPIPYEGIKWQSIKMLAKYCSCLLYTSPSPRDRG